MNQIDHICIYRKFRRAWKYVSVHDERNRHLPQDVWQHDKQKARYNMSVLKTKEVRTVFHFSMSNRNKPLQDQLENNDTNIDTMTLMTCGKTREEVLGRKKTQHNKGVSVNTMKKLDVRNAKKEALNTSQIRPVKQRSRRPHSYR